MTTGTGIFCLRCGREARSPDDDWALEGIARTPAEELIVWTCAGCSTEDELNEFIEDEESDDA
jgi:hypothetical protein